MASTCTMAFSLCSHARCRIGAFFRFLPRSHVRALNGNSCGVCGNYSAGSIWGDTAPTINIVTKAPNVRDLFILPPSLRNPLHYPF